MAQSPGICYDFPSKYNVYFQCSPVNLRATSFRCKINNLESPVQF